jgi:hypothetical protein
LPCQKYTRKLPRRESGGSFNEMLKSAPFPPDKKCECCSRAKFRARVKRYSCHSVCYIQILLPRAKNNYTPHIYTYRQLSLQPPPPLRIYESGCAAAGFMNLPRRRIESWRAGAKTPLSLYSLSVYNANEFT